MSFPFLRNAGRGAWDAVRGRRRTLPAVFVVTAALFTPASRATRPALRVCADPNNLPYSNDKEEGFENQLAQLLARDLGTRVEYTWWSQRRGFIRNTLNAGSCDVVIGVPTGLDMVL